MKITREHVQSILDDNGLGFVEIGEIEPGLVVLTEVDQDVRITASTVIVDQKIPIETQYTVDQFLTGMTQVSDAVRLISAELAKV